MSDYGIPVPDELVLNHHLMHPGADSNGATQTRRIVLMESRQ